MKPNSWRVVGLVARREIRTRLRTKAFRIATLVSVVIVVGIAIVATFAKGDGGKKYDVGVTSTTAVLGAQLRADAKALDATVTLHVVDEATGRDQVTHKKLDAMLVPGIGVNAVVTGDVDPTLGSALHVLAGQVALADQVTALGGDPAKVASAIAAADVHVESLTPARKFDAQALVVGILTGILIYVSLMMNGQAVAQGVVEEKSSRVVELLLAALRPWQLMCGKVFGIAAVGTLQMVIIGAAGAAAGLTTGAWHISASHAASSIIWLVVWYLLGFSLYAFAFAAVAALVSRQEDVQSTITPVLMFLVIGYIVGISVLPSNPTSPLTTTLSLIPMFAPTLMPMRLAMGGVPIWQVVLSVGGVAILIPLLAFASGRIYRNAVMRTGARVRFRDAWRAA